MALAETAQLVARLSLKDDFSRPLKGVSGSLNTFKSNLGKVGKAAVVGIGAGVGVAAAVIGRSVKAGIDSLAELESATTSVDGAIKQMGLTGQVTSGQIADWANEIEANIEAAFDDKEITQAATTLIRFGKVTTSNLKPALTVIADLATKTGSVESAATLLAKALADPEKAAGKLARQGIILTKAQQDAIKAMMATNDIAGAQALILDAVAKSTEGAAKAANGPFVDSQKVLADVVEDAQRALATGFLPVLMEVRGILSEELAKPSTLANIKEFGEGLAGGLRGLIQTARGLPWDAIGGSLKTAATGAKAILDAFLGLPPWVQAAVASGWGLNKLTGGAVMKIGVELVSGAAGGLFKQFFARGATPANPLFVSDVLGGKGGGLPGAAAKGGVGALGMLAGVALPVIVAGITSEAAKEFNANPEKERLGIEGNLQATTGLDLAAFQNLVVFAEAIPKFIDEMNNPRGPVKVIPDDGSMTDPGQRLGLTREDVNDAFNRGAVAAALTGSVDTFTAIRDNIETSRISTATELGLTRGAFATSLTPVSTALGDLNRSGATTQQKLDSSRDAIEASRIATTTALGATRTAVDLNKAATDRARDAVEASRIATVSAVDRSKDAVVNKVGIARDSIETARIANATEFGTTRGAINTQGLATQGSVSRARDAIETARIAQVSATTTSATTISNRGSADAQSIVTAIRNKDFSVKVTVNSSGSPDDRDKPKVTVQTGGNVTRATDPRANGSGGLGGT